MKKKYSTARDPALDTIIPSLDKLRLKDPIIKITDKNTASEDAM